jgi:hypothetical protein
MSRPTQAMSPASLSQRFVSWWDEPAPAARLACLRLAIGAFAVVYLIVRSRNLVSVAEFSPAEFTPVGVVSMLAAPLPAAWVYAIQCLAVLSGLAFVVGAGFRLVAPLFALLLLWVTSYRSSWGMIFHTDNLLVLHVLVLSLSPAADALSWDARRKAPNTELSRFGWPIRTMAILTVITYVLAGVAKLKLSDGQWLGGELLRAHIAYDNLRKIELGSGFSSVGVWFVKHPAVFGPLAVTTMLVELGAPLALFHRRIALVWCIAAWSFHIGVALLMSIAFLYPLSAIAFLPLFRVERALDGLSVLWRRRQL